MKAELKAKWVAKLRSGEYKQAYSILKSRANEGAYCCLGVLCEAGDKVFNEQWKGGAYICDGESFFLGARLLKEFGLNDLDQSALVRLNDIEQKSFNAIADWIEANISTEELQEVH